MKKEIRSWPNRLNTIDSKLHKGLKRPTAIQYTREQFERLMRRAFNLACAAGFDRDEEGRRFLNWQQWWDAYDDNCIATILRRHHELAPDVLARAGDRILFCDLMAGYRYGRLRHRRKRFQANSAWSRGGGYSGKTTGKRSSGICAVHRQQKPNALSFTRSVQASDNAPNKGRHGSSSQIPAPLKESLDSSSLLLCSPSGVSILRTLEGLNTNGLKRVVKQLVFPSEHQGIPPFGPQFWLRHIATILVAIGAPVDYHDLTIEVASTRAAGRSECVAGCSGYYDMTDRRIVVYATAISVLAHEIGHFIDHKWGLEFGCKGMLSTSSLIRPLSVGPQMWGCTTERLGWASDMQRFMIHLVDRSDISNEYLQRRREVFARFIECFVASAVANAGMTPPVTFLNRLDRFEKRDYSWFRQMLTAKELFTQRCTCVQM